MTTAPWDARWLDPDGPSLPEIERLAPGSSLPVLAALRRRAMEARLAPSLPTFDDLARWAEEPEGASPDLDAAVLWWSERSGLLAGAAEEAVSEAAHVAPRELAAAGLSVDPDPFGAPGPFPARYVAEGWELVLGLDPDGQLYLAVDAAPPGAAARVTLPDVGLTGVVADGQDLLLGDMATLLGGAVEYNPVRAIEVRRGAASVTLRREDH